LCRCFDRYKLAWRRNEEEGRRIQSGGDEEGQLEEASPGSGLMRKVGEVLAANRFCNHL
jgi:hypothetical protein